jgi:hypothetical protein
MTRQCNRGRRSTAVATSKFERAIKLKGMSIALVVDSRNQRVSTDMHTQAMWASQGACMQYKCVPAPRIGARIR